MVASHGAGICGFLLTVQLAPGATDVLRAWLTEKILPQLVGRPGIVAAHLLAGDHAASRTGTEEKRLRGDADAIADWIVLVGGYDAGVLQAVRDDTLAHKQLVARGAAAPTVGLYQLLHGITEPDLAVRGRG